MWLWKEPLVSRERLFSNDAARPWWIRYTGNCTASKNTDCSQHCLKISSVYPPARQMLLLRSLNSDWLIFKYGAHLNTIFFPRKLTQPNTPHSSTYVLGRGNFFYITRLTVDNSVSWFLNFGKWTSCSSKICKMQGWGEKMHSERRH